MSKTRIKKALKFLTGRPEAEQTVAIVAEAINFKRRVTAQMDARILAIKAEYEGEISCLDQKIEEGTELLQQWALENPDEFGKKKSIDFLAGTIGFRTGTPKLVLLRGWNWKKALDAVQIHLPNFIRQAPEIDKESILAQRSELSPALPLVGMKVDQGESFFVEPNLTKTETAAK